MQNDPVNLTDPTGLCGFTIRWTGWSDGTITHTSEWNGPCNVDSSGNGGGGGGASRRQPEVGPAGEGGGGLYDGLGEPPQDNKSDCAVLVDDLMARTQVPFLANRN